MQNCRQTETPRAYNDPEQIPGLFDVTCRSSGMAVLEAQAAGLPAIVTDIGGPQEIVDNGRTGCVLSPAEPKAWTQHICTLMYSKLNSPRNWSEKRHEIVQYPAGRSNLRAALSQLMRIELPGDDGPERAASAPSRRVA